ncbi:MAG: DUF1684 domain-containing protein [Bacteroidota bacterium]
MKHLLLLLAIFLLGACQTKVVLPQIPTDYTEQHQAWKAERLANLRTPTGWLSMIGLHWLKEGENGCGSAVGQQIPLPSSAPGHLATYTLIDGKINCTAMDEKGLIITDEDNCSMAYGSLRWYTLERGGRYGIRVQDTLLPTRIRLAPITYFELDPTYRVSAQWEAAREDASVMMRNVLDMEYPVPIEGKLRFTLAGQQHELVALDGGPDDLFLIFADKTTGETTYGGGRYLYCPRPDANGRTIVDFNRAYNPPCAFTRFATCLLPQIENHLPIALNCGEKDFH